MGGLAKEASVRFCIWVCTWVSILGFASCTGSRNSAQTLPGRAIVPSVTGQTAPKLGPNESGTVLLSNGAQIVVHELAGRTVFEAEGTLTDAAYLGLRSSIAAKPKAERDAILSQEMDKIAATLRSVGGIPLHRSDSSGYFTVLLPYQQELFSILKSQSFPDQVVIDPIVSDPGEVARAKAYGPESEGLSALAAPTGSAKFSGLESLHAPEFVAQAEKDIGGGVVVDGSSVTIGATDTGITYNHPDFLSTDGSHVRIGYMKDFTGEGAVFFNPAATFSAKQRAGGGAEDLTVSAQILVTPKLPDVAAGDGFTQIDALNIKVNAGLRQLLLDPTKHPKLGILFEDSLQGPADSVDINGNGTMDDKLFIIYIPGDSPDKDVVYFDSTGTADFRQSPPLGDWNATHSMMDVFAERIGFQIDSSKLPSTDGKSEVDVRFASIVGYDPGNHGTHVSGIAAGRKTIANDSPDTLAHGVAPNAAIAMDRVCANNGGCSATQAFVDLVTHAGVDVINMSLGGLDAFNDGYGVQETMINRLIETGNVAFMIAAGNEGPGLQTVGSPSVARLALAIGATANREMIQRQYAWPGLGSSDPTSADGDDFMLFFSSRGPTASGGFKPEITAPGTELSSVQLNAAPGGHAGLDVYWGTSMATPAATGSYALFLDAAKKFNKAHPEAPLSTEVRVLRQVLVESARPFDVRRFDPATGEALKGQYTWVDEGTGMIDLAAAWSKLKQLRTEPAPAVQLNGKPVTLDYSVVISGKSPNGIAYDGSRHDSQGTPEFATGLYLDATRLDTLHTIGIQRKLPDDLAAGADAGSLTRQLETTADEFALKTLIYGSDLQWLKAGVIDQLDCTALEPANAMVISTGLSVDVSGDGSGTVNPIPGSGLNVCLNRPMIAKLAPGDHGALIFGYRTSGGITSSIPSFIVPIYLTIPQETLAGSTAYKVGHSVASFQVDRNYVRVPKGTSVVRVTLSVPAAQLNDDGSAVAPGQCSGVELMSLLGSNTDTAFDSRKDARVYNCTSDGSPAGDSHRQISFTRTDPTPGIWNLHVFGSYTYEQSDFSLQVDYVTGVLSAKTITGDLTALNGSLNWTLQEASMPAAPDQDASTYEIDSLKNVVDAKVDQKSFVDVQNPLGVLRSYPASTQLVTIGIGGSPGNDIDLYVFECPGDATSADDPRCTSAGVSNGPTDVESVNFVPVPHHIYVARVVAATVKTATASFKSTETIQLPQEKGALAITGSAPNFALAYSFTSAQLTASRLAAQPLFTSGKYSITGSLTLMTSDTTTLATAPVEIKKSR